MLYKFAPTYNSKRVFSLCSKLLTGLSLITAANSAHAIELKEALALAYKNNPSLQSEREALKATDESMPQALSGLLPEISLAMTRGKEFQKLDSVENNRTTDLRTGTVTQPIFKGGGTYASIRKAQHTVGEARQVLREEEQKILLSAVTAYMDIVRDQTVLDLNKNNQDILQKHLDATKERFKLGEVTRTDVAQAEASLAQAKSELIRAEGTLEASKASYERFIGEKSPDTVTMPDNSKILDSSSLSKLIDYAKHNNPSILSAKHNMLSLKREVFVQKSELLPSVDFVAQRQKQIGASISADDIRSDSLTFQMNLPLYKSGAQHSKIRESKRDYASSKFSYNDAINQVRENLIKAYHDYIVSKSSIVSNEASVTAFKSALEGTEHEAKVGARTTLDVLDAEQDLFIAKVNLIRSKRDEIVSAYTVLSSAGKLNAEHLGLEVTPYKPEEHYNKTKFKIIGF